MAEKAIRLGGESTADAIVSAVDAMYTEHTFACLLYTSDAADE